MNDLTIDMNIAFEFVKKEIVPDDPEIINAGAQTGDSLAIIIACLLIVLAALIIGFVFIKRKSLFANNSISASHSKQNSIFNSFGILSPIKTNIFAKISVGLIAILTALFLIFSAFNVTSAFAKNNDNESMLPEKIQIIVDEENNTITVDDAIFKNTENYFLKFSTSSLSIAEETKDVKALEDCYFDVNCMGGKIFYGHPDGEEFKIDEKIQGLNPGETSVMSFAFSDLSVETAKQLYGKEVFKMELKATEFAAANPVFDPLIYNGESQTRTPLSGFTLSGTTEAKNAGTYNAVATLLPNYKWQDGTTEPKDVTWDIAKANATITANNATKIYGSDDPTFSASATGLMKDDKLIAGTDYTFTRAEGKNVGTYELNVNVIETDVTKNYQFETVAGTLTITQLAATFSWDTTTSLTYTGKTQFPTVEVSNLLEGDEVTVASCSAAEGYNAIDAGSEKATVVSLSGKDANNYALTDASASSFYTINKVILEVTTDGASKKYDGSALTAAGYEVTGLVNDETLVISTTGSITNVGNKVDNTYTVTWDAQGTTAKQKNYTINKETLGKLEITPRQITLTSASDEKKFDGTPLTNSKVEVSGDGFIGNEGVDCTVTGTITDIGHADNTFSYTFKTGTISTNYEVKTVLGDLEVKGAQLVVSSPNQEYTYDAAAHGNPITVTTEGGEVATVEYSTDGSTYSTNVVKITNVEDSLEKVYFKANAPNHSEFTGSYSLKINPYNIKNNEGNKFSFENKNQIVYDGQNHTQEIVAKFNGSELSSSTDFDLECYEHKDVGLSTYSYFIHGAGNFTGDVTGFWNISPKTLKADDLDFQQTKDIVYNREEQNIIDQEALTVKDNKIDGGKLLEFGKDIVVVSGATGTNASEISIQISGKGNYSGNLTPEFKWVISPKSINQNSIEAITTTSSFPFDNMPHTVDLEQLLDDGKVISSDNYGFECAPQTNVPEGTNMYTFSVTGKANYKDTKTFYWTIKPQDLAKLEIIGKHAVVSFTGEEQSVAGYTAHAYTKNLDNTYTRVDSFETNDSSNNLSPIKSDCIAKGTDAGIHYMGLSGKTWTCTNRNYSIKNAEKVFEDGFIAINPSEGIVTSIEGTSTASPLVVGSNISYTVSVKNSLPVDTLTNIKVEFDIKDADGNKIVKTIDSIAPSETKTVSCDDLVKVSDFDNSLSPKKSMKATVSYNYSDEDFTFVPSTSNDISRTKVDNPETGKTWTYDKEEHGYDDTVNYTITGAAKAIAVGEYKPVATLKNNSLCWKDETISVLNLTYTITPKALNVKANNKTIAYGEIASNAGYTFDGLIEGDEASVTGEAAYSYTGYTQYVSGVGTYDNAISVSGLSSNNYSITYAKGNLIVEQKAVTLSWSPYTFYQDGEGKAPTAAIVGDYEGYRTTVNKYEYYKGETKLDAKPTEIGDYKAKAISLDSNNFKFATDATLEFAFKITEGRKLVAVLEDGTDSTKVLKFYYDLEHSSTGTLVPDNSVAETSPFSSFASQANYIEFDESVASVDFIKSTKKWFYNFTSLKQVNNLSNLKSSGITNAASMFEGCTSLEKIDLSGFTTNESFNATNMFKTCSKLGEIKIGPNWNYNLGTCALENTYWLDKDANNYLPADIPLKPTSVQTYTKQTNHISFAVNEGAEGKIVDASDQEAVNDIYFNETHPASIVVDAQDSNKIQITIAKSNEGTEDSVYTRIAKPNNKEWRTTQWTFDPNLGTQGKCSGNTVAQANFERVEFGKAVLIKDSSDQAKSNLVFKWDNTVYAPSAENNVIAQYSLANTNWGSANYASWFNDSGVCILNPAPTKIVIEESFKNFNKYLVDDDYVDFTSMSGWFSNFTGVNTISGLGNIPACVTDISYLFNNFKNPSAIAASDLSSLSLTKFVKMDYMFNDCSGLESVDLSSFDTTNSTSYANMFKDCDNLYKISIGAKWNKSLASCSLPGDNWIDANSNVYAVADIPLTQTSKVSFTKATNTLNFSVNPNNGGKITDETSTESTETLYFNYDHKAQLVVDASNKNKLTVTINKSAEGTSSKTYTKLAVIANSDWKFNNWSFTPALDNQGYCVDSTTATANFELLDFAKALLYKNSSDPAKQDFKFVYDNVNYTSAVDSNLIAQYKIDYNTSYAEGSATNTLASWFDNSGQSLVHPNNIIFDDSFKNFKKFRSGNTEVDFTSMSAWFMNFNNVESITGFGNVPTSVYDVSYWFANFNSGAAIGSSDIYEIQLSENTNVSAMFKNCGTLESINLAGFYPIKADDVFSGCNSLKTLKFNKTWNIKFDVCKLPGEAWINEAGKSYSVASIPFTEEENWVTYTKATNHISFEVVPEGYGSIQNETGVADTSYVYFNNEHQVKASVDASENNKITFSVKGNETSKTDYVRKAVASEYVYNFEEWKLSNSFEFETWITQDFTAQAKFELKGSPKAVLYGTTTKDDKLTFYYDNIDHKDDTNFKKQYDIYNTSYSELDENANKLPAWFKDGAPEISPATIEFNSTFAGFTSYIEGKSDISFTSMAAWFKGFNGVSSITGLNYVSDCVTDTSYMFAGFNNNSLLSDAIANLKLKDLKNAKAMFKNCAYMASVDLSNLAVKEGAGITDMFSGCSVLSTITFGSNWELSFENTGLSGDAWLDKDALSYSVADIPVKPQSNVTYTKATNYINFEVNNEDFGTITPSMDRVYFNSSHPASVASSSTPDEINITIKKSTDGSTDRMLTKKAVPSDTIYEFTEWSYSPAPSVGKITENTTIIANFNYKIFAKALWKSSDKKLTFKYDKYDYSDTEGIIQYRIDKNTSYDGGSSYTNLAPWFNNSATPSIQPTGVIIESSFADFKKYIDGNEFTSTSAWFMNFTSLTSITGLSYINGSISDASYMFKGCTNLSSIDMSGFVVVSTASVTSLFANTTLLDTLKFNNTFKEPFTNTDISGSWLDSNANVYVGTSIPLASSSAIVTYTKAKYSISFAVDPEGVGKITDATDKDITSTTILFNTTNKAKVSVSSSTATITITKSDGTSVGKTYTAKAVVTNTDYAFKDWTYTATPTTDTTIKANFEKVPWGKAVLYGTTTADEELKFFYDNKDHDGETKYKKEYKIKLNTSYQSKLPPWFDSTTMKTTIQPAKVSFDSTFKSFTKFNNASGVSENLISLSGWFYGFSKLTTVTGLDNIAPTITNTSYMFSNCELLEQIDFSGFTLPSDATTTYMFGGCDLLNQITISQTWKRALSECYLQGDAWLDDSTGRYYLLNDIQVGKDATYQLADKCLTINSPDPNMAVVEGLVGLNGKIYFNENHKLKITTTHHEELNGYEQWFTGVPISFNDIIKIDVLNNNEPYNYIYNAIEVADENKYQFNAWSIKNTSPDAEESTDFEAVYYIEDDDILSVDVQKRKSPVAVQYTDGSMVFYYDNNNHSADQNFLAQYNVKNTSVTKEFLDRPNVSAVIPDWTSASLRPYNNVTSITFDSSFKQLHYLRTGVNDGKRIIYQNVLFGSMDGWFMNFDNVSSINGLENIPSGVVFTNYMFYGFNFKQNDSTLDLTSFNMDNVLSAEYMFGYMGMNVSNVLLPNNVSSEAATFADIYNKSEIRYAHMFDNSSSVQAISFGDNFGNRDITLNYEALLYKCDSFKDVDLSTVIGLGSSYNNTDAVFYGCIGVRTFKVDFDESGKSLSDLGMARYIRWRGNDRRISSDDSPEDNVWYECEDLIHLHFCNNSDTPYAGYFNTQNNYELDLNVFTQSMVALDERTQTIRIYNVMYSGSDILYEIKINTNDNYYFIGLEGEKEYPLDHNSDFVAIYDKIGESTETAKMVVGQSKEQEELVMEFVYDNLSLNDYREQGYVEAYEIRNIEDPEQNPDWIDFYRKAGRDPKAVVFKESFKNFTSYYDSSKEDDVNFYSMVNWFRDATNIRSFEGWENIPSCVTDIRYIFYGTDIQSQSETFDLSKWDLSFVQKADRAFSNFEDGSTIRKLILPKNFASKVIQGKEMPADINTMFVYQNEGWNFIFNEVDLGDNFAANVDDLSWLFRGADRLNKVKFGNNSAGSLCRNCSFYEMFSGCINLTSVDISGLSEGVQYEFEGTFKECTKLMNVNMPVNNIRLNSGSLAFSACMLLQELDFSHCYFNEDQDPQAYFYNMFYDCLSLNKLIIGESWVGVYSGHGSSLYEDFGLPDNEHWNHNIRETIILNTTYVNSGFIKLNVSIPDDFKDSASIKFMEISGYKSLTLNASVGAFWYRSGNNKIIIARNEPFSFEIEIECDEEMLTGDWNADNYEEGQDFVYGTNLNISPELRFVPKAKAVYDESSRDLLLVYDNANYEGKEVWDIKNEPFCYGSIFFNNVNIDASMKDFEGYYEGSEYIPFTSTHEWFAEKYINVINGLDNLPSCIEDTSSMFQNATFVASKNTALDFRNVDFSNISDASYMFSGVKFEAKENNSISISVFLPNNFGLNADSTTLEKMFSESLISEIEFGQNFAPHGNWYLEMFYKCIYLTKLDLSTFSSTDSEIILNSMCFGCTLLSSVKLWSVDIEPVSCEGMFARCPNLYEVDMSHVTISSYSVGDSLFAECQSLGSLKFGSLPQYTTIETLGYNRYIAERGEWYADGEYVSHFEETELQPNILYTNNSLFTVSVKSSKNVNLTYRDRSEGIEISKKEFTLKVFDGSQIDYVQDKRVNMESLSLHDNYSLSIERIIEASSKVGRGESFKYWQLDDSVNEAGYITGDTVLSATYSESKTPKAVLYKDSHDEPTDFVFVYDDKDYSDMPNVDRQFSIVNTSYSDHIGPEWNPNCSERPQIPTPRRVVIDESFKDFRQYEDKNTGDMVEFYSIDYWFSGMYDIIGLENFPENQIKSAAFSFACMEPLDEQHMTLDFRGFKQDNLEIMISMFEANRFSDIYFNETFGCSAKCIGRMFYYCENLKSLDLRGFNTSLFDTSEYTEEECYGNALYWLNSLRYFIVGDNWQMPMVSVALDVCERRQWITYFEEYGTYDFSDIPRPNVLYKNLENLPEEKNNSLSENPGFSNFSNLLNDSNDNDDNAAVIKEQEDNDLAGEAGAAALVGAPLAAGLLFSKRRIRGKHARVKNSKFFG